MASPEFNFEEFVQHTFNPQSAVAITGFHNPYVPTNSKFGPGVAGVVDLQFADRVEVSPPFDNTTFVITEGGDVIQADTKRVMDEIIADRRAVFSFGGAVLLGKGVRFGSAESAELKAKAKAAPAEYTFGGGSVVWDGVKIESGLWLGARAVLGIPFPGNGIRYGTTVRANVEIGDEATIRRGTIGEGMKIGPRTTVSGAVSIRPRPST